MSEIAGPRDYRILVTGSRDWIDVNRLSLELGIAIGEASRDGHDLAGIVIVHGHCPRGADAMAERIARACGWRTEPHPADWQAHGRAGGFRRNAEMVALGADLCLAFVMPCIAPSCSGKAVHDSHGTANAIALARKAGIEVRRVEAE